MGKKKISSLEITDIPENAEAEDCQCSERQAGNIFETGSIISDNGEYVVQCMTIIGQIEGHYILSPQNKTTKYEHIIPMNYIYVLVLLIQLHIICSR